MLLFVEEKWRSRGVDPNDTATADRLRLEAAASGRRPGSIRAARGAVRAAGRGQVGAVAA